MEVDQPVSVQAFHAPNPPISDVPVACKPSNTVFIDSLLDHYSILLAFTSMLKLFILSINLFFTI